MWYGCVLSISDAISGNSFQDSFAKPNIDRSFTSVKYWEYVGVVARSPSDAHVGYGWLENSSITQCYLHSIPILSPDAGSWCYGWCRQSFLGWEKMLSIQKDLNTWFKTVDQLVTSCIQQANRSSLLFDSAFVRHSTGTGNLVSMWLLSALWNTIIHESSVLWFAVVSL